MLVLGDTTASLEYLIDSNKFAPPAIYADDGGPDGLTAPTVNRPTIFADFSNLARVQGLTFETKEPVTANTAMDLWLWDTFDKISAHRDLEPGWLVVTSEVPSHPALDAAETLAAGFAGLPINRRPQFGVDTEGQAGYSTYENGFYLHLTIDQEGKVSWYSVEDGVETFVDDVVVSATDVTSLAEDIMSA